MPITMLTQPLVLSEKTLKGDERVDEEGLNKVVNFQCFNNEKIEYNM